jgi:hypothetical protein
VKPLDTVDKISNLLGAGLREEVVHAVDDVSLASSRARSWAWSASPAAASPRWAAWRPACTA